MPQPTFKQYMLATDWPLCVWQTAWAAGSVGFVTWWISPDAESWSNPIFVIAYVMSALVGAAAGWLASVIPGWLLFGPILYWQGIDNGGPFRPGDHVYIIAGKHRGTIAPIYNSGQHDSVRVDLGDEARQEHRDYFAPHQLLRVDEPNA